ncbi:MAG: DUF1573 domain-containing protein [Planctomycetota bacterium]|nr:DUF1573 domain-containing protein [Planctomycetota bacterium]
MRPGPIIVAVLSLIFVVAGVSWLGQSVNGVNVVVDPAAKPKPEDSADFPKVALEGPQPKVGFEETEYDFGTKPRFSTGSHKFVVTNSGPAPLKLMAGETTCQCTVGELGKNEVAAGESTTVELSWTIKQPGPGFQHSAKIHTNDPANPMQTLIVKGFIGVDMALWPAERWSMGSLKVDGSSRFEGFVYSHNTEDFDVDKIECESPGLEFQSEKLNEDELKALSAGMAADLAPPPDPHGDNTPPKHPELRAGYRIRITANDRIPVGQFSVPALIHTSVDGLAPMAIAVSGVRPGPYQFFPLPGTSYQHANMLIDAGIFSPQEEHTAGLLVVCRGFDGELKIEEATADPAWLKVSLEPASGEGDVRRYRLLLKFPAGLPSIIRTSSDPATLAIRTNHPNAGLLNLKAAFAVEE